MQTLEDDFIRELFVTTSHHYVMFFTNTGRVYRLKAYEIPEASRTARGTAIINLLQLMPDEKITATIPIKEYEDGKYLFMATKKGLVKRLRSKIICKREKDRTCGNLIKGRRSFNRS